MQCDVKVVVILIHKYSSIINILFWYSKKDTKAARASTLSGVRGQGLGVHSVCGGLERRKMTGFHAHRHTSLLTRLRTHRLPGLVAAQHPETKAGLLPAQVHLDVLVLRS